MTAGERFSNWVDKQAKEWSGRLGKWAGTFIGAGLDAFMKIMGKSFAPKLAPLIDFLEKTGEVPPELQPILDEIKKPTGEVAAMFAQGVGGGMIGGAVGKVTDALFNPLGYKLGTLRQNSLLSPAHYITEWLRGKLDDPSLDIYLHQLNLSDIQIGFLKELSKVRLDPLTAIKANWRGFLSDTDLINTLRDQGLLERDRVVLEQVSKFYPDPPDLIRWQAREVFEPEMIERYGLDSEYGAIEKEPFYKAGMTDDQILNYWRAHWEHASWMQVVEMLHRGLLTEAEVWDWFRVVEIPPFWRQHLIDSAYTWPTRVDVRRWWDMRTIDETELRRLYSGMGYRGVNLDNYVLWTKVYVAFPDLMARWKNGWISLDQVKSELTGLGMPAARVDEMIETKIKTAEPERTAKERDLTKTDIYKGIKADRITRDQGVELLMDLGFDEDEADVLLDTNVPEDVTDKVVKQRELTKGDIKTALKEDLLTPSQAVDKLMVLRYSRADSDFLVELFEHLIPIAEIEPQRELAKTDIARGISKGILAPREARAMLLELRYSEEDADYLVSINMPAEEVVAEEKERQLAKTDIKSAFKVGLITADEAISRLEGIGYSPDDARFLVSIYQAIARLVPITKPREASKADVVEAVKRGLLTSQEGYTMLIDLDFTPEAATFILEVRATESPFSPVNFAEFKERTGKLRKAAGMEKPEMPEEVKAAADEVVRLTGDRDALSRAIDEEKRGLVNQEVIPVEAAKRLKSLQVKRNRAESKLSAAKQEYDRLVAEWRHALP